MKKIILLKLFFIFSMSLSAQWNLVTVLNTGTPYGLGQLKYACFCSPDSGIYSFYVFLSPSSGFFGQTNVTVDAGINWSNIGSGNELYANLYTRCLNLKNDNILYIIFQTPVGQSIFVSRDGGLTKTFHGASNSFLDVSPIDSSIYFSIQAKALKKYNYTVNQSSSTTIDSFPVLTPKHLFFLDTLNGYVIFSDSINLNSYHILKTTQGGGNWSVSFSDTSKNFNCILFPSFNTGYVAGSRGAVFKTNDSGLSWQNVSTGLNKEIKLMDFFNDSVGIIAGDSGFVMTTTNGGLSWNLENLGSDNIYKVYCFNDSVIYVLTQYAVYKRTMNVIGIEEISGKDGPLDIYPNPTSHKFTVSIPKEFQKSQSLRFNIINNLGKLVQEGIIESLNEKLSLDLYGNSVGIYFITLTDGANLLKGRVLLK